MDDPIKISSPEQADEAVEQWRQLPIAVQVRNLKLAVESLELSIMYYEQKGNEQGVSRAERCISIIKDRLKALP